MHSNIQKNLRLLVSVAGSQLDFSSKVKWISQSTTSQVISGARSLSDFRLATFERMASLPVGTLKARQLSMDEVKRIAAGLNLGKGAAQ